MRTALGGAAAFGFIGLVIGPIDLVITARLLETRHGPALLNESAAATDMIVTAKAGQDDSMYPQPDIVARLRTTAASRSRAALDWKAFGAR